MGRMMNIFGKIKLFQFFFKFLFVLFVGAAHGQQSPCPSVFQYQKDFSERLYGVIRVPSPNVIENNLIELHVDLSIGNEVSDLQGSSEYISFLGNKQDVLQKRPLNYRIDFPTWRNIPPQIVKITLNGVQYCRGPSVSISNVQTETTLNLLYKIIVNANTATNPSNSNFENFFFKLGPNKINSPVNETKEDYFLRIGALPNNQNFANNWQRSIKPPPINDFLQRFTTESILTPNQELSIKRNLQSDACGVSMYSNKLIVHGDNIEPGMHPWIGALFWQERVGPVYKCGASLISESRAITAAHCLTAFPKIQILLVFGRVDINDWSNKDAQILQVASAILHPQYNYYTADADIGVAIFSGKATFTPTVQPICLWSSIDSDLQNIIGEEGTILGWGSDENGNIANNLKETFAPIVSEEDCLRSHGGFNNITSDRTFCAGFRNNAGPCDGDSGGGFYMYVNGKWNIRGIVSHALNRSNGKCDLRHYVVYVDVAKFLDWLKSCCG